MKGSNKPLKILIILIIILLVGNPEKYFVACHEGILVFAVNVLPALLPFFFFTKLLTALGVAADSGRLLAQPMRLLYGASACSGYVFVMSLTGGYPVGAKLIADLYKNGCINEAEAKNMCAFTSTSGPMFVLGSIGTAMLQNRTAGLIILLSHYASALINGFIYRKKSSVGANPAPAQRIDNLLGECVYSAVISVLSVGVYIAVFYVLAEMLSGLLDPLELPYILDSLLEGLVEMTRGCLALSSSNLSYHIVLPSVTALVTFGGLSVMLQSLTFIKEAKVKASFYLLTKLTQTTIAVIVCYALTVIVF